MKKTFYEKVKEEYIYYLIDDYLCNCSPTFAYTYECGNGYERKFDEIYSHAAKFVQSIYFGEFAGTFELSHVDDISSHGLFKKIKLGGGTSRDVRMAFLDYCIESKLDIDYLYIDYHYTYE